MLPEQRVVLLSKDVDDWDGSERKKSEELERPKTIIMVLSLYNVCLCPFLNLIAYIYVLTFSIHCFYIIAIKRNQVYKLISIDQIPLCHLHNDKFHTIKNGVGDCAGQS